jgi:phytoene synthase
VRDAAWAAALARFLVAVPELEARGRIPLVDGRAEAVSALAAEGRRRLARAHGAGQVPGAAAYALYAGWQAEAVLRRAAVDPAAVAEGGWAWARSRQAGGWRGMALGGRW